MCTLDKCAYAIRYCELCGFNEAAATIDSETEELLLKADVEPEKCSDAEFQEILRLIEMEADNYE